MKNRRTHKSAALFLAIVFAVFNIGIPVVLASCPMGEMTSAMKCAGCPVPSSGEGISKSINISCCSTKIVAERNTTEFSKPDEARDRGAFSVPILFEVPVRSIEQITNLQAAILSTDLPPPKAGIPVLVSSLLI